MEIIGEIVKKAVNIAADKLVKRDLLPDLKIWFKNYSKGEN